MRADRTSAVLVKLLGVCLALGATAVYAFAQTAPTTNPSGSAEQNAKPLVISGLSPQGDIHLLVNKSVILTTSRPLARINVAQPEIFDANLIGANNVLVTAKKAGSTQLILWDQHNNAQMIDILVQSDLRALREMYPKLFPSSQIEVVNNEGNIALIGHVPDLQTADQAATLAQPYGNKVLNLLEVAGGQQIMLQVKFAEVSRTAISQLGVNIAYAAANGFAASNIGQISPFNITNSNVIPDHTILGVPNPGQTATVFGQATWNGQALNAFIAALRSNNLLRVLAEPTLTATSGQEASFLAGGEYPIPIAQGGAGTSGNNAITIEFKEFGVKLRFTPVVLGNGKIRLKVAPEVSDLDYTTAVQFGGFVIPGLTTRRVETTVELAEGQTFAIAGLLNNNVSANKDVVPLLGDMPVLGTLFRSVRYQRKETELMVLVTPHLAGALKPGEVPLVPGEHWRHPSDAELFLNQDIGGPEPTEDSKRPPRPYMGRYGFMPATQPSSAQK